MWPRMRRWIVRPATRPLRGAFRVPGDKSISHRAWILASLAEGTSVLRGVSPGEDVARTRAVMAALGVTITDLDARTARVEGVGLGGLRAPAGGALDCGNAGTSMRLLAGVLAAQGFDSTLVGDASLSRRPMGRITRPLRARGANVEGVIDPVRRDETAPLTIRGLTGGRRLFASDESLVVASAQVKSCLLLSGLFADGGTSVREPTLSRDHTERMLLAMGAPLRTMGPVSQLDPQGWSGALAPLDLDVPGDPSAAAFWVVAAHVVEGSRVQVRGVGVNPTRTGFLEALRDQGGGAGVAPKGEAGGEPVGDLHVGVAGTGTLRRAAHVAGELTTRCIDEIPALVAAAAVSPGESRFEDLAELRVKESDRVAALAALLAAFGIAHRVTGDGLTVVGGKPRGGAVIDSRGDHRIAMAAAVLALAAEGETTVDDVACVDTSDPDFAAILRGLGGDIEVIG
ncbi:MAG: aroA [Myxococcaceae bacterium]|nr:aroA [Myxococcaceae bacterium]